jgi:hypothetical protein
MMAANVSTLRLRGWGRGGNVLWGEAHRYHAFLYPQVPNLHQSTLRQMGLCGPPAALVASFCTILILMLLSYAFHQY